MVAEVGDGLAAIVGVATGDELATLDGLGRTVAWDAGLQAASIRATSKTVTFPMFVQRHGSQKVTPYVQCLGKRNDPNGSPRWLRHSPCGWRQRPRSFPSGPSTTVTRPSWGPQSLKCVAWLRLIAARP